MLREYWSDKGSQTQEGMGTIVRQEEEEEEEGTFIPNQEEAAAEQQDLENCPDGQEEEEEGPAVQAEVPTENPAGKVGRQESHQRLHRR